MLKRPHYIALGLVVLLTLVILNLPSQTTTRFKLGIGSLFLPLFGLASSSQQLAGTAGEAIVPRRELLRLNDGLRVNLPVLTTDGLVGRISSVSLTRSQVVLLGDPNCKVSARVENETRDTGIIGPSGPLDTEFVELGYLSRNANLKPAQDVVSSGEGGIFPHGIPIGKIVDVEVVD